MNAISNSIHNNKYIFIARRLGEVLANKNGLLY